MELVHVASRSLLWIVLLPLTGAALNGLIGRYASRQTVSVVGVGTIAASFVLALLGFFTIVHLGGETPHLSYEAYRWFSVTLGHKQVPIEVNFLMDPLSGVMALIVTGVGLLIHIYATGYMHDDPGYARFFGYLNLFMASMLVLVLASNLPLMFVGWEGVGLCSYLLIGFWWENTEYAKAGRKAFVANRIGDFGVLIGMFILASSVGSFEFVDINASAPMLSAPFWIGSWMVGSTATVACLFLFLGCTGKSAQIPLYVWLPDAMAGPTPVSALIHAATMVTAGVYLCCRLSHLFLAAPVAMAVVAIIGSLTALLAASIALAQNEMKKVLAYSTISQLGFMFSAVGVGAFAAGIFHVLTHAFFKACLFLCAGSVMHAVGAHGDADIRKLGGLRKIMPTTHWTFLASTLAISGFPLFSGFFSKDEILLGATRLGMGHFAGTPFLGFVGMEWVGWFVFVVLVLAAIMTALYMFRLYFVSFTGEYRSAEGKAAAGHEGGHAYNPHPHESPSSMTVPLMVLGAGAIAIGWLNLAPIGVDFEPWVHWLHATLMGIDLEVPHAAALASAGGLLAVATGIGAAWWLYVQRKIVPADELPKTAPALHRGALGKWYVDELYRAVVIRPVEALATLAGRLDKYFVDMVFAKLTSLAVQGGGWLLSRAQTGLVYAYGAVMVIGIAGSAWWFLYPHVDVKPPKVEGTQVELQAARGLGYEYRWDAGDDGRFETTFTSNPSFAYEFEPGSYRAPVLLIDPAVIPGNIRRKQVKIRLADGESFDDWGTLLGPRFEPSSGAPPVVQREGDHLIVHPNGVLMRVAAKPMSGGKITLHYGQAAFLAGAAIQVGAAVRVAVDVRNAFGNVGTQVVKAVVQPAPAEQQPQARLEVKP